MVRHAFLFIGLRRCGRGLPVPLRIWQAPPVVLLRRRRALVLVLIPGVGQERQCVPALVAAGVANLQPSELMKLAAVL